MVRSMLLLRRLINRGSSSSSSSISSRSARFSTINEQLQQQQQQLCNGFRHTTTSSFNLHHRTFFSLSPASISTTYKHGHGHGHGVSSSSECRPTISMNIGSRRFFSEDVSHLPTITDPEIEGAFKDLMALSWEEIPDNVIHDVTGALSKDTEDKAGKEVLENVFRAAEAVEQFTGVLISLRMEIDDSIGMSGENVRPLSDEIVQALSAAYKRYTAYLDSFTPDETYLRKKVETELGTRMIHLKMRCSGLGAEWGKVGVLGTSGLSGSYVEHRAP